MPSPPSHRDCLLCAPPSTWVAAMVKSVVGVLLSALQALKHMELYLVRVSTNPPA